MWARRCRTVAIVPVVLGVLVACGDDGTSATRTEEAPASVAPAAAGRSGRFDLIANEGAVEVGSIPADLDEASQTGTDRSGEVRRDVAARSDARSVGAAGAERRVAGGQGSDVPTDVLLFQNELEPRDMASLRRVVVAVMPSEGYDLDARLASGEAEPLDLGDGRRAALYETVTGELSVEIPAEGVVLFVNSSGLARGDLLAIAQATRLSG